MPGLKIIIKLHLYCASRLWFSELKIRKHIFSAPMLSHTWTFSGNPCKYTPALTKPEKRTPTSWRLVPDLTRAVLAQYLLNLQNLRTIVPLRYYFLGDDTRQPELYLLYVCKEWYFMLMEERTFWETLFVLCKRPRKFRPDRHTKHLNPYPKVN